MVTTTLLLLEAFLNSSWLAAVTSETAGRDCLGGGGGSVLPTNAVARLEGLLDHVIYDAISLRCPRITVNPGTITKDFQRSVEDARTV